MDTLLYFKGTINSPEVKILESGNVYITGSSTVRSPELFFDPISRLLAIIPVRNINVNISIAEINKENSVQILKLLEIIKTNPKLESMKVLWVTGVDEISEEENIRCEKILGKPVEFIL